MFQSQGSSKKYHYSREQIAAPPLPCASAWFGRSAAASGRGGGGGGRPRCDRVPSRPSVHRCRGASLLPGVPHDGTGVVHSRPEACPVVPDGARAARTARCPLLHTVGVDRAHVGAVLFIVEVVPGVFPGGTSVGHRSKQPLLPRFRFYFVAFRFLNGNDSVRLVATPLARTETRSYLRACRSSIRYRRRFGRLDLRRSLSFALSSVWRCRRRQRKHRGSRRQLLEGRRSIRGRIRRRT
mmetsp:Transcript_36380/g.71581  ORF Transcript_36380/g.71581 Transcript_36380/m.71581 type:complete len:239 (+) Transcript_36380:38-754(+)